MQRLHLAGGLSAGRGGDQQGPPVVFVHGAMDRGSAFLRTVRHLRDTDWWVYDRRGYGRSTSGAPVPFEGHVADLVEVLELVHTERGRPAVVVGHSIGGAVVLAVAHRRPDLVAAAVSFEAPMSWCEWWPGRGPGALEDDPPALAAERFMRRVAGDEIWEALPASTRARRLAEGEALVAELSTLRTSAPYVEGEIPCPVVVSRGAAAVGARTRAAGALVAALPAGELVVLDDVPHGAHLSDPVAFAGLVRRALERAGADGSATL